MLRGRTPPPPPPPARQGHQGEGPAAASGGGAQARRASWHMQMQEHRHRPTSGFGGRSGRGLDSEEAHRLISGQDDDTDELEDWRQGAQMLTERDEMLLLAGGDDVLDVAPVNRRLQQANERKARRTQTPTTTETSSRQSPINDEKRTIFTLRKQLQKGNDKKQASREKSSKPTRTSRFQTLLNNDEDDDESEEDLDHDENYDQDDSRDLKTLRDRCGPVQPQNQDQDDNSSISFAQSGCHSILSVWRIKAANRAARLAAASSSRAKEQQRPRSVLSNSSSIGKKSAASTAYTTGSRAVFGAGASNRIPLGPKSAQHFVTNTRRRRRANELIMNTLEARRRAISLNRQNILGSQFGSESYLGASPAMPLLGSGQLNDRQQLLLPEDYQRLSMSPSPARQLIRSPSPFGNDSTAAAELMKRSALSDLGGRQSPATMAQRSKLVMLSRARRQNSSPLLAGAGPTMTTTTTPGGSNPKLAQRGQRGCLSQLSGSSGGARPPLAKLDQNSSDLCSSNESSSGGESQAESSSSSGSQFTQLVTSELTPSRILLGDQDDDDQDLKPDQHRTYHDHQRQRDLFTLAERAKASPTIALPPKPPSRTKRRQIQQQQHQQQLNRSPTTTTTTTTTTNNQQATSRTWSRENLIKPAQQQVSTTSEEDDKLGGKLRRGALKRDSIRRLRLSRQQQQQQQDELGGGAGGSSSSNDYSQQQQQQQTRQRVSSGPTDGHEHSSGQPPSNRLLRPLSKARKLDIESNPFLNRHHFRTVSSRSTESRQSFASQRASRASPSREPTRPDVDREGQLIQEKVNRGDDRRPRRLLAVAPLKNEPESRISTKPLARAGADTDESRTLEMPQIDMENVRQVERMLRDLQPSQVDGRVNPTSAGTVHRSETRPKSSSREPLRSGNSPADSSENVFKTTTRLVREGARSSDNVKSDLAGNRKQVELRERWRHEHQPPVRRDDGSIFSEDKYLSERLEVRKSHELIRSISPPAEFSDRNSNSEQPRGSRPNQQRVRSPLTSEQSAQFEPTKAPEPTNRYHRASATRESLFVSERPPLPAPAKQPAARDQIRQPSNESPRARPEPVGRELAKPDKPAVLPRPRVSKGESINTTQSSRPSVEPKRSTETFVRAAPNQTSLPKFERTADDEFRKRVDQLRQIARANLSESEAQREQEARRREQTKLVKPLSTNWEGPKREAASDSIGTSGQRLSTGSELSLSSHHNQEDRTNRSRFSSSAPQSKDRHQPLMGGKQSRLASTNLDDMLLADRYQRPLESSGRPPMGAWRRSNSSLASVGSSRPTQATSLPSAHDQSIISRSRPMSPLMIQGLGGLGGRQPSSQAGSVLSQSAMSTGPREGLGDLPAPMRVIVREKRAPQLDFAQVEQRPPTQTARTVEPVRREQPPAAAATHEASEAERITHRAPPPMAMTTVTKNIAFPTPPSPAKSFAASRMPPTDLPPSMATTLDQTRLSGSQTATTPRVAPHLRATSPRSPEFGRGAASSNDDSAIASSISSPSSMSFVMSGGATTSGQPSQHLQRSVYPNYPSQVSMQKPDTSAGSSVEQMSRVASQPSGPTIQSILRRQQIAGSNPVGNIHGSSREHQVGDQSNHQLLREPSGIERQMERTAHHQTFPMQTQFSQDSSQMMRAGNSGGLNEFRSNDDENDQQQRAKSPPIGQQQTQKRVHFNDRTSVRSFESISSTNSNTTAIQQQQQQHQQSDLDDYSARQQVGSPDSMGSGSTSRLSCESPAFGDFRRGGLANDGQGGAAIYAVRGDPDLELASSGGAPQLPAMGLQTQFQAMARQQHQPTQPYNQLRQPPMDQHHQIQRGPPVMSLQYPSQGHQFLQMSPNQPMPGPPIRQKLGPPVSGSIQMTAPPAISTSQQQPYSSQYHRQPMSPTSVGSYQGQQLDERQQKPALMVVAQRQQQQNPPRTSGGQTAGLNDLVNDNLDEDDPDYALRLRQVATRRVFNYIQPAQQLQQKQDGFLAQLPERSSSGGGGGSGGAGQAQRRKQPDLANFQTEV